MADAIRLTSGGMRPIELDGGVDSPVTYVILLNWNGWKDTICCLESVFRLRGSQARVVVCDNASTDDSVSRIREWCSGLAKASIPPGTLSRLVSPPVPKPLRLVEYGPAEVENAGMQRVEGDVFLLHTGANLGFAGGCNVGIRFALARNDADFVWLLNNDTIVEPDALLHLVERASRPDRPDMVGSTLCFFDASDVVQSLGGGTFKPPRALTYHIAPGKTRRSLSASEVADIESRMMYVVGASMLVSRRLLERVGLMQEDYFLYFEEIDWAERARRLDASFKLGFAAGSVVYHKVGASAGTHARSLLSMRYFTMNRLRFVKRFYPRYLLAARIGVLWEGLKATLKGRIAEGLLVLRIAVRPVKI